MAANGTRESRVKTLLILGGTGDLSHRLLLPGLARLIARGRAPGLVVVGSGSRDWSQAYGEVLEAVIEGNRLLSVRGDIAEECWRIVDPVLAAWRADEVPMDTYAAGTQGPSGWTTSRGGL